ncbi:MAG: TIGR02281 family clan AA aspartic protease [Pseudomonadota bacterium]
MLQFVLVVGIVAVGALIVFGVDVAALSEMTTGEIATAIFLALVSIVFVGSVIGAGQKLSSMSRHLAIAIGVTLSLVIAWEYRYELQDVASRVTAGVIPGSPISRVDEDGAITVTLSRINRHFQTLADVNGSNQPFIIDTGASTVVLTYENARDAGFDVSSLAFVVPVYTANGTTRAAPIVIDELAIGDISRRNVRAMVAQQDDLFQNLLGMTFLDRLAGYDVRGSRMILRN